jgi:hypothetical protein
MKGIFSPRRRRGLLFSSLLLLLLPPSLAFADSPRFSILPSPLFSSLPDLKPMPIQKDDALPAQTTVGAERRALLFYQAYLDEHGYVNTKIVPEANKVVDGYNLAVKELSRSRWRVVLDVAIGVVVSGGVGYAWGRLSR